jgi:benzoate membrane transport protein
LALVGVLATALQGITRGPLLLGPMFAFAIALSKISVLGLGPFFWSLVLGTGVTLLLERDEWNQLRATEVGSSEARADLQGPDDGQTDVSAP